MKSKKFYKTLIMVLIMLNITTIAVMWFGKPPHPPKPGENKISDRIGVVGESKIAIDKLEKEHHVEKRKLVRLDIELHEKLYDVIGIEGESKTILDDIAENKDLIEAMTFEFFDSIADYCSVEQKKELRNFIQKEFSNLRPGPPKPKK